MEDFDGNCIEAEPQFRKIRRRFSYSRYAALAELRIADCMMQDSRFAEAVEAYSRFARQRPAHPDLGYARFRIAEAYVEQIPGDWFPSPPAEERDQAPTRKALDAIRDFLLDFPNDPRAPRATEMAKEALALLARHELYVANYYLDRDHPQAAIGRLNVLLAAYGGSGVEPEALILLGRTHLSMNQRTEARAAFQRVIDEYRTSTFVAQARAYIADLGL